MYKNIDRWQRKILRCAILALGSHISINTQAQSTFLKPASQDDTPSRIEAFEDYKTTYSASPDEIIIKIENKGGVSSPGLGASVSSSPASNVLSRIQAKKIKALGKQNAVLNNGLGSPSSSSSNNSSVANIRSPLSDTFVVTLENQTAEEAIKILKDDPEVEYVEPNYHYTLHAVPNDPFYASSGAWNQPFDDLYGMKQINAADAWDITEGSGVVVAVVDSGVEITHPDLASNIWLNAGEIANNGIDDDNNGFIDDVNGWNFHDDNNDVSDDVGHGTHVAGTVAAVGNNNLGVIGVAPLSKIMPVRALGASSHSNEITLDNLIESVIYAVDNGADVINASWGGPHSQALTDTVAYAYDSNVVFVASAGNEGLPAFLFSPAGIADAITVGANDHNDELALFSNWGAGVDISGPGVQTLSTAATGGQYNYVVGDYGVVSGTSMSAPHVSGAVALIRAIYPNYSVEQVRYALREGADDAFNTDYDLLFAHGRLNAEQSLAVNDAPELKARIGIANPDALIGPNFPLIGTASGADFYSYEVELATPTFDSVLQYQTLFTGTTAVENDVLGIIDITNIPDGWYMLRLTVEDSSGKKLSAESFTRISGSLKAGWPQSIPAEYLSSDIAPNRAASFADLNNDGIDEVIGTSHSMLHAWHADGSVVSGFPVQLSHPSAGAVSIYDVDQDGYLDIITPVSALDGSGEIYVYDRNGSVLSGYPVSLGIDYVEQTVQLDFSRSVNVVDLDGDSTPELFFIIKAVSSVNPYVGYKSGDLYAGAINLDGTIVGNWPKEVGYANNFNSGETIILDRDGDGDKEIFIHTGIFTSYSATYYFQQYSAEGVHESNIDFPEIRGLGTGGNNSLLHAAHVVDLDNDGNIEIAVVTGATIYKNMTVSLLDKDFNLLPGWPRVIPRHYLVHEAGGPLPVRWPLLANDVDGDSEQELVYLRGDVQYAYDKNGNTAAGYPIVVTPGARYPAADTAVYAPTQDAPQMATFFPSGSYVYAVDSTGTPLPGWEQYQGRVVGSLAAKNIDGDNTLEIASVSSKGAMYVWEVPLASGQSGQSEWQTFGGDNQRSFKQYSDLTPSYQSVKPSMFVRGQFNSWATQTMELVDDYTWQAIVEITDANATAFKFDVLGDWTDNFGDNNADNVAEAFGNNISFPGTNSYRVRFNDSTLVYSVTPANTSNNCVYPIAEAMYGSAVYESYAMNCIDGIWQVEFTRAEVQFRFSELNGDSVTYGDDNSDGQLDLNGALAQLDYQGASSGTLYVDAENLSYNFVPDTSVNTCSHVSFSTSYQPNGVTFRTGETMACENGVWSVETEIFPSLLTDYGFNSSNGFYGDSNNDGYLDSGQSYLTFSEGAGRYLIEVNDNTLAYTLTRIADINQPPIVSIFGDLSISLDPSQEHVITFDASGTFDPEGDDITFEWSTNEFSGIRFLSIDEAVVKVAFTEVPEFVTTYGRFIILTVTDSHGQSSTERVYVEQANSPFDTPTLNAGPDLVVPLSGGSYMLDGEVTNGVPIIFNNWGTIGHTYLGYDAFSPRTSLSTELTVPPARDSRTTYIVTLRAENEFGDQVYDSFTVHYQDEAQQNLPSLFLRGNFNAWASDTPLALVNDNVWEVNVVVPAGTQEIKFDVYGDWSENYGDNNADGVAELGGGNIAITQGAGTYTVRFNDATFAYTLEKQVIQQAPIANAGADHIVALSGGTITLDGSASYDPDGSISSYWWIQTSGPALSIVNPTAAVTSVTLPQVSQETSYTFELHVEDNDTLTSFDTLVVTQMQTSFDKNYDQVYARGTFNSWGTTLMTLVDDHLWEVSVSLNGNTNPRMKFDIYGDWSFNFGDNNSDGVAEQGGNDIPFSATTGTYTVRFNDETLMYSIF